MKTLTKDPVCGMDVEETSPHRREYEGILYLFCSAGCRRKFEQDPGEFVVNDEEQDEVHAGRNSGDEDGGGSSWRDYIPLLVIVALTLLAASAKQFSYGAGWDWMAWMHDFMGFFLIVFSMFKFFNLEGFADGFQMYDLLAKRVRAYAYAYPFIELALGLGYLSHWQPGVVYSATIIVMIFGSLGVISALRRGLDVNCACMGTVLKVPLSTVALTEDLGMAAMAAVMLLM